VFEVNSPGDYMFCFSNVMSFISKVIDFDITVSVDDEWTRPSSGNANSPTITAFEKALTNLRTELRTLQNYQRYFKVRDARNLYTVEGTEQLILWFSIFESLLIIGMAILQVHVLRKFFTNSGKVRV
jgi:hypothetical protein